MNLSNNKIRDAVTKQQVQKKLTHFFAITHKKEDFLQSSSYDFDLSLSILPSSKIE